MEEKNTTIEQNLENNDVANSANSVNADDTNSTADENVNIEKKIENVRTEEITEKSPAEEYDDEKGYKEFVDSLPAKWYVLHTFSGYENVAKENLETVIEKFNLQDRIFDIVIPMEEVVEEKNGKKRLVERKSMPCYILVKMKYADDIWHNVIRTRGITGFVGPKGRPLAMTEEEVIKLGLGKIKVEVDLKVGERVEIVDGALKGQIGEVTDVNTETGHVSVNVEMFNRVTPVDVELSQVRRINN